MKTTEETIKEIEQTLDENIAINPKANWAVLYFDSFNDVYDNVDWNKISDYFMTEEIHSYTMTQKIVITVKPDWRTTKEKLKIDWTVKK